MRRFLGAFAFRREPVVYLFSLAALIITAARVAGGADLSELMIEEWYGYAVAALMAFGIRATVTAPESVDRLLRDLNGSDH
ncbi:hypothetical protein J4H86_04385 [Spiractinospora alimapuensis]|uniref:hypothetical protein n=1 Tax=Spiractinospora alimapuensis TaxID=2820884 RepID=UPI001F326899|nr:hypothetical protein [Spiractinospora alimapuensis]QVQ53048.1 hypothetical protein J4H86_04385 [Spiractinospora alimapuensis]